MRLPELSDDKRTDLGGLERTEDVSSNILVSSELDSPPSSD